MQRAEAGVFGIVALVYMIFEVGVVGPGVAVCQENSDAFRHVRFAERSLKARVLDCGIKR